MSYSFAVFPEQLRMKNFFYRWASAILLFLVATPLVGANGSKIYKGIFNNPTNAELRPGNELLKDEATFKAILEGIDLANFLKYTFLCEYPASDPTTPGASQGADSAVSATPTKRLQNPAAFVRLGSYKDNILDTLVRARLAREFFDTDLLDCNESENRFLISIASYIFSLEESQGVKLLEPKLKNFLEITRYELEDGLNSDIDRDALIWEAKLDEKIPDIRLQAASRVRNIIYESRKAGKAFPKEGDIEEKVLQDLAAKYEIGEYGSPRKYLNNTAGAVFSAIIEREMFCWAFTKRLIKPFAGYSSAETQDMDKLIREHKLIDLQVAIVGSAVARLDKIVQQNLEKVDQGTLLDMCHASYSDFVGTHSNSLQPMSKEHLNECFVTPSVSHYTRIAQQNDSAGNNDDTGSNNSTSSASPKSPASVITDDANGNSGDGDADSNASTPPASPKAAASKSPAQVSTDNANGGSSDANSDTSAPPASPKAPAPKSPAPVIIDDANGNSGDGDADSNALTPPASPKVAAANSPGSVLTDDADSNSGDADANSNASTPPASPKTAAPKSPAPVRIDGTDSGEAANQRRASLGTAHVADPAGRASTTDKVKLHDQAQWSNRQIFAATFLGIASCALAAKIAHDRGALDDLPITIPGIGG